MSFQQGSFVPFGFDVFVNLPQIAIWIDDEAGAIPVERPLPVRLADTTGFKQFGLGVREQINGETELVAKAFVRCDIVLTDTHSDTSCKGRGNL